jgi:hypothetical protein
MGSFPALTERGIRIDKQKRGQGGEKGMAKGQPQWVSGTSRSKPRRAEVPETVKAEVITKTNELIETVLKPQHIQPPPENPPFNYIVDIYGKWYRSYFYVCATYCTPGPNSTVSHFETRFARLEYAGNHLFHLSAVQHSGRWGEWYTDISLNECLVAIQDEPLFLP